MKHPRLITGSIGGQQATIRAAPLAGGIVPTAVSEPHLVYAEPCPGRLEFFAG